MLTKKILIISHEFPPQIGGVGSMGWYLYDIFKDCDEIDVTVLTRNHSGVLNNSDIIRVPYLPKLYIYPYLRSLKSLNLDDYHTIILNGQNSTIIGSIGIPSAYWKKCIVYIHGSELETYGKQNKIILNTLYKNYFLILEKCQRVIFCSNYLMNKFQAAGIKGNFKCIPNFVDENIFYQIDNNVKNKKNILISVGRLVREKGYDQMLEDFYELIKQGYNYKWVLIGSGTYKKQLEIKIKNYGLTNSIELLGNIPREELKKYYSIATLFWLYSESESFGLSYLEANACGLPFLKKGIPGLEQISKNNVNSFNRDEYTSLVEFIKFFERTTIDSRKIISLSKKFSKKRFSKLWFNELDNQWKDDNIEFKI